MVALSRNRNLFGSAITLFHVGAIYNCGQKRGYSCFSSKTRATHPGLRASSHRFGAKPPVPAGNAGVDINKLAGAAES
jgi:hypothetical protein